jgi:WD40 repeat protein
MSILFRFVTIISLISIAFSRIVADDAPPPQIEPVEFIDIARPQQADPANRRTAAPAVPTGWGFAVFSSDNKTVATVLVPDGTESKGEVILWDVADPKPGITFTQQGRIAVVAFSPDGKWLAIGPNGPHSGVNLVDTKTGKIGLTLPGPVAKTNVMTWSPDGSQLVLGSTADKSIRVWNVPEKKLVKVYEPEASRLFSLGFTKTGTLLAAGVPIGDRDGLAIFDVVAGKIEKTLKGHKELIEAAAFTPTADKLTSVGWDAMVRVWDVEKGEESAILKGHKKGVRSVTTSSGGKRLASSGERELKLWDGEKHELLADLGVENAGAKFVTMSSDGAWFVSIARDGTARLWDVEKKAEKAKLDRNPQGTATADDDDSDDTTPTRPVTTPLASDAPEPEAIQSLAYSRDGKWIAIAREDGKISIRHAADGKVARELDAFSDVAACVAFSQDSQRIAAGSFDKSIKVWNVATGERQADLIGHTNWVFSVVFSADGQTLASGSYDKTVKLWNIAEKKEIATLSGHTAGVRSVVFTADGQLLISGSADRTAIVWNLADGKHVSTLKGHAAAIRAVAISPDGSTGATASEDATVKLWKTADWSERASLTGTEGVMFWCVAFSPAGRTLAVGGFDGSVKLYDPSDGKVRQTLQGPTDAITAVAFAPGANEVVAGSVDKSMRRWKAKTAIATATTERTATPTVTADPEKPTELKSEEAVTALNAITLNVGQPVSSLAFSKEGKQLAVGGGGYRVAGSLQLWDVVKREKKWQGDEFKFGIPAVAFSNDEKRIAIGNFADNFLRMIDVTNGKQLKEIRGHRAKIHGIAFSPDGTLFATASLDRDIKLWDASTNKEVKTLIGHNDYVYSIAFTWDGKKLLSGSADRTARLWDVESAKESAQLKGHQGAIQQAVFSKDGLLIACASADGTVRIYHGITGDFLMTLRGHRNRVETVAFSSNGKLIATGSADKTVRLWIPESGVELLKLSQDGIVRVVLFSPDGKHLASGCDDKTVKIWDVSAFEQREPVSKTSTP